MRAATTTPVGPLGAGVVRFPRDIGLPRYYGGSAPTTAFRGLLSVRSRCGPHGSLTVQDGLFLECFSPFVTS